jgi:hypothetical protein
MQLTARGLVTFEYGSLVALALAVVDLFKVSEVAGLWPKTVIA